jgi:hypothetical protein
MGARVSDGLAHALVEQALNLRGGKSGIELAWNGRHEVGMILSGTVRCCNEEINHSPKYCG